MSVFVPFWPFSPSLSPLYMDATIIFQIQELHKMFATMTVLQTMSSFGQIWQTTMKKTKAIQKRLSGYHVPSPMLRWPLAKPMAAPHFFEAILQRNRKHWLHDRSMSFMFSLRLLHYSNLISSKQHKCRFHNGPLGGGTYRSTRRLRRLLMAVLGAKKTADGAAKVTGLFKSLL